MKFRIEESDFKKIRTSYRAFSFFICIILLVCLVGILAFGLKDNLFASISASLILILMLFVLVPIVKNGYPPKVLLWTLDRE